MNFKNSLINAMQKDTDICKHLFTKLPFDSLDFKPAESMRTMLELLKYLTWTASSTAHFSIKKHEGSKSGNIFSELKAKAETMNADEFPARMDEQMEYIKGLMNGVSEEDLLSRKSMMVWGDETTLGYALLTQCVKHLTAYRMQLFLYAKMAGAKDLDTVNCWLGEDYPGE